MRRLKFYCFISWYSNTNDQQQLGRSANVTFCAAPSRVITRQISEETIVAGRNMDFFPMVCSHNSLCEHGMITKSLHTDPELVTIIISYRVTACRFCRPAHSLP